MSTGAGAAASDDDKGEIVVNVGHLMEYVNEQKDEGNGHYKAGKHSEALAAWQRALEALAQAEGKPMRRMDVETVLRARATLHANKGQALLAMEFWQRAIKELTACLEVDKLHAKALWRRYKAKRELASRAGEGDAPAQWADVLADFDRLLSAEMAEAAAPLLKDAGLGSAEQRTSARAELEAKRQAAEKVAEQTFEDRAEWAQHQSIERLRLRFEEVTQRNGLHGNSELSAELADMVMRPGGVTAQHVAATYQIDDDDAEVLMQWTQAACKMRDEIGYNSMDAI